MKGLEFFFPKINLTFKVVYVIVNFIRDLLFSNEDTEDKDINDQDQ